MEPPRRPPGQVRDAIVAVLQTYPDGASPSQIEQGVQQRIGTVAGSSIRSYLRLNTPELFEKPARGLYRLRNGEPRWGPPISELREALPAFDHGRASIVHADCLDWLRTCEPNTVHAVVTDPPYGLVEYSTLEQEKLRAGRGGVWRIPPSFDGAQRSPLPRFTTLSDRDKQGLEAFFETWARLLLPVLVPGANVVVATNPLLSYLVSGALARGGLERRGELVRLVTTMRGGDRPKGAHVEFEDVSVMPRSMWEPWLLFRKPPEGRIQDNLRKWSTGGFRRPESGRPFGDVIRSAPTRASERKLAPHPSLKPQRFLRPLVQAVLPLGKGVVLDPFCGAASTLAAANAVGYKSVGIEKDPHYYRMACEALPQLAALRGQHRLF